MRTIRKFLSPMSFFLAALILFTSCEQYDTLVDENLINKETMSEKDLFTTLFFGNQSNQININHVNELNAMRSSLNKVQLNELDKFTEKIIQNIEINDVNFFSDFKKKIHSNNHYLIEEAIDKSGKLIQKSMLEIPEIRDKYLFSADIMKNIDVNKYINENGDFDKDAFTKAVELEYGDDLESLITPTILFLAVAVFVAQTVGLALSYWVGVFVTVKFPKIENSNILQSNTSKLQKEILVNDIYENF